MQWTAWTTLAVLAVYLWVIFNAGRAREHHKVAAPSMDGPLAFQSAQRVHANTVEQLVMLLPALWLCAYFLGDRWAAAGGALWIVGRVMYALGYYQDPSKRGAGFGINLLAVVALMLGTAVGLMLH
ncbi:MAPEG family protein [Undibacterium arcticum]|uniref:MAPEG family protein n=1 Tax=Undibacterium arcticum TaxID=1762892 RepID=A0ABV7F0H2_9BURK